MLHQALLSLIERKSYETITVEEICETANVGRSAFYTHYAGKDDLKRSGLEHLRKLLIEHQKAANTDLREIGNGFAFSLPMFEHARDHLHHYRALIGTRGGAIALGTIREIL